MAELFAIHLALLQQPTTTLPAAPIVPTAAGRQRRRVIRPQLALLCGIMMLTTGIAGWIALRSVGPLPRKAGRANAAVPVPASPPSPPVSPVATANAPRAPAVITAEAAKRAVELIAAGAEAARQGEIRNAIDHYTEAARLDPTNTRALLSRATLHSHYRIKNWPAAIADATEVIRLNPQNAEAFAARAGALYQAGDHRRAIEDATQATQLDPNQDYAFAHRGGAYRELGEWKHAIVDLNEFLSRLPNSAWPLFNRALAYSALGDDDRAFADVNRAIELNPRVNHFPSIPRTALRPEEGLRSRASRLCRGHSNQLRL